MPTETSAIGSAVVPVPSDGTNTTVEDRTLLGILDFLGFIIKEALDAKLTEQGGPVASTPLTDACPVDHRFPWDHGGSFMRPHVVDGVLTGVPLPGLWAWEVSSQWSKEGSTLVHDAIEREIKVQYIFPQLSLPDGINARHGLMGIVGKAIARAASRGLHMSYGYNGDGPGTPIWQSLNLLDFQFLRGAQGRLELVPAASTTQGRNNASGAVQHFYPAYEATISVIERIEAPQGIPITDETNDATLTIAVGDDVGDTIDVLERVIIAPRDDAENG